MSSLEIVRTGNRNRLLASLAMIGSAGCWGSATVMSRDLLDHMSPPGLLVIQLSASVAVLVLFVALREAATARFNSALRWAALPGILEPGLAYTVGLIGLGLTTASNSSIISSVEPVFIVFLSWLLFRERPSKRLALCMVGTIAGLLLVVYQPGVSIFASSQLVGDMLVCLATLFAAGYVVLSARAARSFPTATLAGAQQALGLLLAIIVYVIALAFGLFGAVFERVDGSILLYAGITGIIQYALAFSLYLVGLRYIRAGVAGLYLTLTPVFGIAGAYFWLGEEPTILMLFGTAIIIFFLFLARDEE